MTPIMGIDSHGLWNWGTFWKVVGTVAIIGACVALAAVTGGVGAVALVGLSTTLSVGAQGVSDLVKGEFSGIDAYLGAAIGGAISGLGAGIGTTMLTSGLGNVAQGLFTGSISTFQDASVTFMLGMGYAAIGYGISKGISSSLAASKISKIMGNSSKNSVINKRLAEAGYGYLKIGRDGLEVVAKEIYKEAGFETIQNAINLGFDFVVDLLF
ncbi:MAG: hypothetical protein GX638_12960 [Crenarchaeota archaeon]|nr:hypothetical protein [Thermoproteota archaeon]